MHWVSRIRNRFRAFTNIQAVDRDLDDEVTAHLEAAAAEYQSTGLSRKRRFSRRVATSGPSPR